MENESMPCEARRLIARIGYFNAVEWARKSGLEAVKTGHDEAYAYFDSLIDELEVQKKALQTGKWSLADSGAIAVTLQ